MPDGSVSSEHPMTPPPTAALAAWLAEQSGARDVALGPLELLEGGAVQLNWGFDATFDGGTLAGQHALVLRIGPPTPLPESRSKRAEFAALIAAWRAGLPVPEPLFLCDDPQIAAEGAILMRRLSGNAAPNSVRLAAATAGTGEALAVQLARVLASIHRVRAGGPVAIDTPRDRVATLRRWLDALDGGNITHPVLRAALDWLDSAAPAPDRQGLVHRDFRTGNFLVEDGKLVAVLDWEFAGLGDPHEDIGWFCATCWRGDYAHLAAGGLAPRTVFYDAYETRTGQRIDDSRIRFWEVFAHVRWALIALQQGVRAEAGDPPRHELVEAVGRVPGLTRDIARMTGQ